MYVLVLILLLGVGVALARAGFLRERPALVWTGMLIAVATLVLFSVLSLWGEALWFQAAGYGARFWTFIGAQASTMVAGALIALVLVLLINTPARRLRPVVSPWAELVGATGGALWGLDAWQSALLFVNRTQAGISEPVLGLDAGFYLFVLPFLDLLQGLLLWILVVAAVSAVVAILLHLQKADAQDRDGPTLGPVAAISASLGRGPAQPAGQGHSARGQVRLARGRPPGDLLRRADLGPRGSQHRRAGVRPPQW